MSREYPENGAQTPANVGETPVCPELKPAEVISRLHAIYNQKTGADLKLRPQYEALWKALLDDYNWNGPRLSIDLQHVIRYLKKQIDADKRYPGALKLINLLQIDRFESDLALAREAMPIRRKLEAPAPVLETAAKLAPEEEDRIRLERIAFLKDLKEKIRRN